MPDPASPQGHGPGENPSGPGGVNPGVAKLSDLPGIYTPPAPGVPREAMGPPPQIPDHELSRVIGGGSYGQVWLGRNAVGTLRAIKVVHLQRFEDRRHFDREFKGLQKFEPVSRTHEGLVDVLQLGRNDAAGYFYYVMELADDGSESRLQPEIAAEGLGHQQFAESDRLKAGL